MWDEPPHKKNRTVDLAGFASVGRLTAGAVVARAPLLKPRDASPAVEAVKKARRSIEGRNSGECIAKAAYYTHGLNAACHGGVDFVQGGHLALHGQILTRRTALTRIVQCGL